MKPLDAFTPMFASCERLKPLQELLSACPTCAGRKSIIMSAWENLAITDEDATLLIEANGLETD